MELIKNTIHPFSKGRDLLVGQDKVSNEDREKIKNVQKEYKGR